MTIEGRVTADIETRLRETAINDEGVDWWASSLLREVVSAKGEKP